MRDQFICGIRDEATRVELFKQTTVTFDTALKEATARERAVANAAGALKTLSDKTYKQENFAIDHSNGKRHEQQKGKINKNKNSFSKRDSNIVCYCCGNTGHTTKSCKYRDQACRFCNIKGHLERACIKKKKKMGIKFLQEKDNDTGHEHDEADNAEERSYFVDFHALNAINNRYICNMTELEANPMFIKLKINDKLINMEVDTGSYFAVISEGFVRNNLKTLKILNSSIRLLGYEDNTMKPLGQLENLRVTLNGKTAKERKKKGKETKGKKKGK